jgi:hypothetical protein
VPTFVVPVHQKIAEQRYIQGAPMRNKLRRESRIFSAVNEVFKGVVVRKSNDDFARISLEQAKALTGSQFGWVGQLNDQGLLDTLAMDAPGWDVCKLPESTVVHRINDMAIRGIWGDVIKRNASLICNDPAHYPNAVGLPEGPPQINAFLGVPLKGAEKTIGMDFFSNGRSSEKWK